MNLVEVVELMWSESGEAGRGGAEEKRVMDVFFISVIPYLLRE